MIPVPEELPPDVARGTPTGSDADPKHDDVRLAGGTRITDAIVGHFADQARRTASAAKAGRVVNAEGEPGLLDLTLLRELVEELRKLKPRDWVASVLRQAADIIDSRTPNHRG